MTELTAEPRHPADVVVLGAGLFGAALTHHLSRDRSGTIVLVDAPPAGALRSATLSSAGILTYPGWDAWDLALLRETNAEYQSISDRTGHGGYRINGGIRWTRTVEGEDWLERARGVLARNAVEAELVGPDRAADLFPSCTPEGFRTGLFVRDDAIFSAPDLAAEYLRSAVRRGVVTRLLRAAPRITSDGSLWQIHLDTESVETANLVLACGAWTKGILERLRHPLPLAPFRAQACLLRPLPLSATFPTLHDIDLNLYVRPAFRGRLLAGNGTETTEADPDHAVATADRPFVDRIREEIGSILTENGHVEVEEGWAGLCVASPDPFPLVGKVPGATGLFVASGFNGFGAMRAAALASRLARGILEDRWDGLVLADPGRFPAGLASSEPRPKFPLESDRWTEEVGDGSGTASEGAGLFPGRPEDDPSIEYRPLGSMLDIDRLGQPRLSEWFDPFLPLFMKEALRTPGRVEVAESDDELRGIYLRGAGEKVGSLFTRTRAVAAHYLRHRGPHALYAEEPWESGGEPIDILAADLRDWEMRGTLRNLIRIARPDDLPPIRRLMRESGAIGDDTWFDTLPRPEETAFLCEIEGRIAGVSWVTRVGRYARGHSFMVQPRFRGLGVGTDLLRARMLWLRRMRVVQVVSEIYDGNVASRTAAERAGMACVARMFHYPAISGG